MRLPVLEKWWRWRLGMLTGLILLLLVVPVNWMVTVVILALATALAVLSPGLMVGAVLLSIPVQDAWNLPFVRGELTCTQVMLSGLILGFLLGIMRHRIWLDAVVVGFLLIMAAYVNSLPNVISLSLWFGETYRWAVAGVFYVICRSVLRSWRDVQVSLWAMAIGVTFVSVHSVFQQLTNAGPENFRNGHVLRVFSTFGTPNTLAAYVEFTVPLLVLPVVLGLRARYRQRLGTSLWIAMVVASAGGAMTMGMTQSRGGWIGFAVALVVLWTEFPRRYKAAAFAAAVTLLVVILVTPSGRGQLERFGRLWEDDGPANVYQVQSSYEESLGRKSLWMAAIRMTQDHPLDGVGAGQFDEYYREYSPEWVDRFPRGQAHDVWLQMGAQAGLPGIIAYGVWLWASMWNIFRATRVANDRMTKSLCMGALAVFVAYLLHSMVDYLNVLSLGLQLSVVTAIALNIVPSPLARYADTPPVRTRPLTMVSAQ